MTRIYSDEYKANEINLSFPCFSLKIAASHVGSYKTSKLTPLKVKLEEICTCMDENHEELVDLWQLRWLSLSKGCLVSYSIRKREWECQRRLSGWLWGCEYQVLPGRCWQVSRFVVSYMLRLCRVRFSIRNQPWLQLAPNSSCRDDCEMEYEKGIVLFGWNGRRKLSWSRHHDFVHCVFSWLAVLSRFLVTLWAQLL